VQRVELTPVLFTTIPPQNYFRKPQIARFHVIKVVRNISDTKMSCLPVGGPLREYLALAQTLVNTTSPPLFLVHYL
jgi:hypothetical protein